MGVDLGKTREDKEESAARAQRRAAGQADYYDLTDEGDGVHQLRLLPPDHNGKIFIPEQRAYMPVYRHFNIPNTSIKDRDGNKRKASCICIKQTFPERGESCPICEVVDEMWKYMRAQNLSEEVKQKVKSDYYLQKKAYGNVISRDSKDTQVVEIEWQGRTRKVRIPKVFIVGFTPTVKEALDTKMTMRRKDNNKLMFGDITRLDRGFDIIITVTGKQLNRKYNVELLNERTPLADDPKVVEAIMQSAHDIGAKYPFPDRKGLNEIEAYADAFRGYVARIDDIATGNHVGDDDDDEKPQRSKAAAAKPKRTKPACFGNHVPGMQKCVICPAVVRCKASERSQERTVEMKKKRHARLEAEASE